MSRARRVARLLVLALLCLATLLLAAYLAWGREGGEPADPPRREPGTTTATSGAPQRGAASVRWVIDGDTLDVTLDGRRQRVRLQGIDAPESVGKGSPVECLGPEAAAHLRSLAPVGSRVTVEWRGHPYDRYGRLVAGVRTQEGLLNERMAEEGLARPLLGWGAGPYDAAITAAYRRAQLAHRGLFDPASGCRP
ncbi:MAG: thermonuclease family protein [Micrococcales bacterium]|nr:thermonuclease family protein [Micrococcales bacterium]